MKEIYCDNSATTPVYPEVIEEMETYFKDVWGNPSSIYARGRIAKQHIEVARLRVAQILNCEPEEVYFTSGGSESDNLFIKGCFKENSTIITSPIEHPAVLNACKAIHKLGAIQITLPVNDEGAIDMYRVKELSSLIQKEKPIYATVMLVNNETGAIQPIRELANYLRELVPNIIIHTDAVQAVGKVSLDVKKLGVDSMSLSGHKFGAPKGIGIFYLKKGIECNPIIDGGGQESGLRNGTENVPYIMGITKALEMTYQDFDNKQREMFEFDSKFIGKILSEIKEAKLNLSLNSNRAYGVINIRFNGINAQNLLLYLDNNDIYVSAGSACHSDSDSPSHVLKAIGLTDDEALSSLRFSFKHPIPDEDIDYIVQTLKDGISLQKQLSESI
jgi:cysteine desulfurase